MIGIDLFCGAGGMSLGATMSGVKVIQAIDASPQVVRTYARNHKNVKVLAKKLEEVTPGELCGVSARETLVVFGGPPCRGFSTSNQRTRSSKNPDNWLFREYLRIVSELSPDWVIFENVPGILQTEGGRFVTEVMDRLTSHAYYMSQWVLNAADFGVPQRRSRLFLVGSKGRVPIVPPMGTCRRVTVAEAISDLPPLTNGASRSRMPYRTTPASAYARKMRGCLRTSANHLVTRNQPMIIERYSFVPQGGNWESIPGRLMKNYEDRQRCHKWIYLRLRSNEPSVVIGNYRKNMLIHPWQDRGLSVREAARLQSFPDWFEFTGSIGFQQQQVGNALPPLLARAVFDAVRKASAEISQIGEDN